MPRATLQARIVKNTFVLFGGQATLAVASAVTTFALARGLGVERFGEYNAVIAFVGLFLPLANIGLDTVLVREMSQHRDEARAIFGCGLILRLIASLIAVSACVATSIYLQYSQWGLIAIWSLVLIFSAGQLFQVPFSLIIDNIRPVGITTALTIIGTLLRLALIFAGVPLVAYLLTDLVINAVTCLALWQTVNRYSDLSPEWTTDWRIYRRILNGCLPLLVTSIMVAIYNRIDQQFLLRWRGTAELGQYAAAVRLAELVSIVPVLFMRSAFPVIAEASYESRETTLKLSSSCYRYLFLLTFPLIFAGIFASQTIINTVYGHAYSGAAIALPWLMLAEIPVIAGIIYGHFSIAAKLQKFDIILTFVNAAANVVLCVVLIPEYGLKGAAIASLVGYSIGFPVQLLFRAIRPYSLVLLKEALRILGVGFLSWVAFILAEYVLPGALAAFIAVLLFVVFSIQTKLIRREDSRLMLEMAAACRRQ